MFRQFQVENHFLRALSVLFRNVKQLKLFVFVFFILYFNPEAPLRCDMYSVRGSPGEDMRGQPGTDNDT